MGKLGPVQDAMENWNSEWQEEEKRARKNTKVYPQVNKGMLLILDRFEKAMKNQKINQNERHKPNTSN